MLWGVFTVSGSLGWIAHRLFSYDCIDFVFGMDSRGAIDTMEALLEVCGGGDGDVHGKGMAAPVRRGDNLVGGAKPLVVVGGSPAVV